MTLTQIKYFETVCFCGSITKAAEELYISRPVVSRALHELETEFGAELFERTRTGLELTESGRILRNLFSEFSGAYSTMLERIQKLEQYRVRRTLNVGITTTTGKRFFPGLYQEFHSAFPDIRLYVKEIPCYESRASVQEGRIDVFFTPAESEPFSMFGEIELYKSEIVFCASTSGPIASRKEITVEETLAFPIAGFISSMPVEGYRNIVLRTSQQDLLRKVVAEGAASAVLPLDMVEDWAGVACIPFNPPRPFTVKLIWNKSVPHNSAFDDFMDFVEKYDVSKL
jgi:DNA-binding transcriptional LysR family regulator